jgi:hypothetical protein
VIDPRITSLEKLCGPTRTWAGRCNHLAMAMVEQKLASGDVVFGVWRGRVAEGVPTTPLLTFGGVLHSWIARPDGTVMDPTRWVFEGVDPYIYEGPADLYQLT